VHLDAVEHGDSIVFLHALKDGPADRSYGLHVAALAGVPQGVIARARARLEELEARPQVPAGVPDPAQVQMPLFAPAGDHPCLKSLKQLDPDSLSPREALDLIYRLKADLAD